MAQLYKFISLINKRPLNLLLGSSCSVLVLGCLYKSWQLCQPNIELENKEDEDSEDKNEKDKECNKKVIQPDSIELSFEDVKGYDGVKDELEEYVQYFQQRNKFQQIGGEISLGCVIVGSEGYGKTHLVHAFAGQAKATLYQISLSEKDGGYFSCHGEKIDDIKELFNTAKENSPAIIFIDDLDKRCRGDAEHKLRSFLSEMDKLSASDGVIVMVTSQYRYDLPDDLFKSKRFENIIKLPILDYTGRKQILSYYLTKVPVDESVDSDVLSRLLEFKTPKVLKHIINRSAITSSMENQTRVGMQTIIDTIDKIELGPGLKSCSRDKESLRITAYHEIGHALVIYYTKGALPLFKATIVAHDYTWGHTSTIDRKEETSTKKGQLLARLDTLMGGRVAEEILLGKDQITTGVRDDLSKASSVASKMVKLYGMSEEMNSLRAFDEDDVKQSDDLKAKIDSGIDSLLNESYSRVTKLLTEHKDELDLLATALLLKKTLYAEEIKTLIEDYTSKNEANKDDVILTEKNGSENSFDLLAAKSEVK